MLGYVENSILGVGSFQEGKKPATESLSPLPQNNRGVFHNPGSPWA